MRVDNLQPNKPRCQICAANNKVKTFLGKKDDTMETVLEIDYVSEKRGILLESETLF